MRADSKTAKRYDREFKLGAVKLVLEEGRSPGQVAEALGTTEQSVRRSSRRSIAGLANPQTQTFAQWAASAPNCRAPTKYTSAWSAKSVSGSRHDSP